MSSQQPDFPDLRPDIEKMARKILGEPNKRLSTRTELRFGTNGSVSVEIAGIKCGHWYDHEAQKGGGPWELLTVKGGMANGAAVDWLRSELGIEIPHALKSRRDPVATYDYRDERGDLLFQVCRFEPKDFRQRRPDGKGGWIWSTKGVRRVPYRLPELLAAPANCLVFIVEGEKDADRVARLDLVATCNPGGAAKPSANGKPGKSKWRPELNPFFEGRNVVLVPDNDVAGSSHAQSAAANLKPFAASVRILELPGLPPKGDVSDWLDAAGTREELLRLAADTPVLADSGGAARQPDRVALNDEAEIARLAQLSPLDYERERGAAAKRLGCSRTSILDRLVESKQREGRGADAADTAGQGRRIEIADIEQWPEPVNGTALLDEFVRALRKYVIIPLGQANAVALWTLQTHAGAAFDTAPYLWIYSAERRSGKRRLMSVLRRCVRRGYYIASTGLSAATLLRLAELFGPTLLLDELDTLFKGDREFAEALRGLLNSGFEREGALHPKLVPLPGSGWELRGFNVYGPKALAGIGELPITVVDRSVRITMVRKRREDKVDRLRSRDGTEFYEIARKMARWAADHLGVLSEADPEVPDELNDRAADAFAPLLAIADTIGGSWPKRARDAARELCGEETGTQSRGEQLLADIRDAFDAKGVTPKSDEAKGLRISSDDLVAYLVGLEGRPWAECGKGAKPITKNKLAGLLRPFKVTPGSVRLDDGRTPKGYYRDAFKDVFECYLPPTSPFQNATTPQASKSAAFSDFQNATSGNGVAFENCENPSVSAACGVVADENPPAAGDGAGNGYDRDPEEATWMA
jgi:hypothetical protein